MFDDLLKTKQKPEFSFSHECLSCSSKWTSKIIDAKCKKCKAIIATKVLKIEDKNLFNKY